MLARKILGAYPKLRGRGAPVCNYKEVKRLYLLSHHPECSREKEKSCSMSLNLGVDLATVGLDGSFNVKVYLAGAKDVYPHVNQLASKAEPAVQGSPDDFLAAKGDEVEKYRYQMKNKVRLVVHPLELCVTNLDCSVL